MPFCNLFQNLEFLAWGRGCTNTFWNWRQFWKTMRERRELRDSDDFVTGQEIVAYVGFIQDRGD